MNRLVRWYCRRKYGAGLDSLMMTAHHRQVMLSTIRMELSVARWDALDSRLKMLAVMASAHRIGCSWCTDFGYWIAIGEGIDEATIRAVPQWRDSDRFTPLERDVMDYAERASGEVTEVTDELVERIAGQLGTAAMVELAMMVAVENLRSRFNGGLGLTAQGFKDRCELTPA